MECSLPEVVGCIQYAWTSKWDSSVYANIILVPLLLSKFKYTYYDDHILLVFRPETPEGDDLWGKSWQSDVAARTQSCYFKDCYAIISYMQNLWHVIFISRLSLRKFLAQVDSHPPEQLGLVLLLRGCKEKELVFSFWNSLPINSLLLKKQSGLIPKLSQSDALMNQWWCPRLA